jgi:hypothetical protein
MRRVRAQVQPSAAGGSGCVRWERTWQKRLGTPSITVQGAL